MTDKERLEDIKEKFMKYEYDYNLSGDDIEWLIEQAERVQELKEQNQRYREALEFYADQTIYKEELINEASYDADGVCISNDEYAPPVVYLDGGEKARKALEGKE
ncbi:hypothetical protein NSS91_07465 [Caldifermentibacillus hisashii]|uniref:hypothetical protein n=1 Tax=Caldifermentibacillus hisashii TaxID=996558 RepID=UPI0031FD8CB5